MNVKIMTQKLRSSKGSALSRELDAKWAMVTAHSLLMETLQVKVNSDFEKWKENTG